MSSQADPTSHLPVTVLEQLSLAGKVAVVTGAGGYLGKAIAAGLAEAGATIIATSRSLQNARSTIAELPNPHGQTHLAASLDQLNADSIPAAFAEMLQQAGKIDILVNNAHEAVGADWTNVTAEQFNRQLGNATAYFLLSREFRNHLVSRQGRGSIILLGSMYGSVGSYPEAYEGICAASPVAYHALKGGILQMTRHLAVYWAKDGVRVNALSPGPFPAEKISEELKKRLCERSPMARMGRPEELKGAVVFLASDASSYVTGHNLVVDGGWTAW